MWSEFYLTVLEIVAAISIPGALLLKASGTKGAWTPALAPAIGFSFITILGQLYALVGIRSSPITIMAPVLLASLLIWLFFRRKSRQLRFPELSPIACMLTLILGIALGYNLFVSRLESPSTVFQAYDVTQHLNLIQAMSDSGKFTSLGVGYYLSAADSQIAPVASSGFYPAAWHALCALAQMSASVSAPIAINASMFALCFIVYPLSMVALASTVFPNNKRISIAAALVSLAFVAFPWELLTFGPVYPNIAGFCFMPAVIVLFMHLIGEEGDARERAKSALFVLIGIIGLALCHPNTIFTCIALMIPYCISRILAICKTLPHARVKQVAFSALFIVFCLGFWLLCYHLPIFKDIVSHWWPPYAWLFQELINIITVSYHNGFNTEIAAQLPLAFLVVIGAIRSVKTPGKRWVFASYVVVCYVLLVGATHSDSLREMVSGFWYSDPMRLSAVAAIGALPLAAYGLEWLYGFVQRCVAAYYKKPLSQVSRFLVAGAVGIMFIVLNFMPEFNLAGINHELTEAETTEIETKKLTYQDWPKNVHTTFGDYRRKASDTYSVNAPLDQTEKVFLKKAKALIQDGALIINDPMDGSFLAYGTDDMRMYYRNFIGFGGSNETPQSQLIRTRLCDYATDEKVRAAVVDVDAKYVVVLRGRQDEAGFIDLRDDYDQSEFVGITSISESTPGFKLLLKTGPMALYEIER